MGKTWYTSKTLWVNFIAFLALVIQSHTGIIIDIATQMALLAFINFILRIVTRREINWKGPSLKLLVLCVVGASLWLTGCGTTKVLTDIGAKIGASNLKVFEEKGKQAAADIKKSWPYAHGAIKGAMGPSYEFDLSANARKAAQRIDELCEKETLTPAEMGEIVGSTDRFGWYWTEHLRDKYGVPLWGQIESLTGIAVPF